MNPGHGRPQLYEFLPGTDKLTLIATGSGSAGVVFYPAAHQLGTASVYTFAVHRGQTGTLTISRRGRPHEIVFAGRRYAAHSGIGLTIRGLPRRLPKRARTVRITIRDQFGEIVPGVEVTLTHRHLTTHVRTNVDGLAAITLVRESTATVLRVSAVGYRTVVDKLK